MKTYIFLFGLSCLLAGCGTMQGKYTKVILKHPETLEFQECEVGHLMTSEAYKTSDECIEKYKAQGYEVWGER